MSILEIVQVLLLSIDRLHMVASSTTERLMYSHILGSPFSCLPFYVIDKFIGVGIGVGVFLLLMLSTEVVFMLLVVIVKRKSARKQKMYYIARASLWYHNSVVVEHEEEKKEAVVVSADNDEGDGYQDVAIDKGEDDNPLDGFITYEVIDRRQNIKNTMTPAPKDSPTPASAPNVPAVYGVVNEKKKRGAKKTVNGSTVANNDPRDVMSMKKWLR